MKLAHLADLHLGFRQFDRQTPRGGNQREADVAQAFARAVDDLLEQRPNLVLVAGDVFHSVRPTNPAILFLFQQLQRLRVGLPDVPVVLVAGNHDTPRSADTGTILRLYEALGVHVVNETARRLVFPSLDCAVLAVPHQALIAPERPALRPERGGPRFNVLLAHGELPELTPIGQVPLEFGGAPLSREELGIAHWDYVALGHFHVANEVAPNCWYAGSLEYVSVNIWGDLREQSDRAGKREGKGYLLVDLPGAKVTFRPVAPARRFLDLPPVHGSGLTAKEVMAQIEQRVGAAKPSIDDQVVRLVVYDVSRGTAADLDHAAIRAFKARALNFQLDIRRPESRRVTGVGAPGSRLTLPETVRGFLAHRPLDADLDRDEFVRLGVHYVEQVSREDHG
ncbi:MAG TPA: exonuclease SbcCD subunit D [Gemmatimonadales bacterium]|nr:exonuclease SbcCD subunit D [Gemmatimonadales bacterium]